MVVEGRVEGRETKEEKGYPTDTTPPRNFEVESVFLSSPKRSRDFRGDMWEGETLGSPVPVQRPPPPP